MLRKFIAIIGTLCIVGCLSVGDGLVSFLNWLFLNYQLAIYHCMNNSWPASIAELEAYFDDALDAPPPPDWSEQFAGVILVPQIDGSLIVDYQDADFFRVEPPRQRLAQPTCTFEPTGNQLLSAQSEATPTHLHAEPRS